MHNQAKEFAVRSLSQERQHDLLDELEESLDCTGHEKRRAIVKYKQPRWSELLNHKQRHERHVRAMLLRNRVHDSEFSKALNLAKRFDERLHKED